MLSSCQRALPAQVRLPAAGLGGSSGKTLGASTFRRARTAAAEGSIVVALPGAAALTTMCCVSGPHPAIHACRNTGAASVFCTFQHSDSVHGDCRVG